MTHRRGPSASVRRVAPVFIFCLGDFIIKVTLERHRAEVKGMLLTEYNEAQAMELFREEGRAEGRVEGEDRLARLMKLLFGQRRFEDAQRAATDAAFRDQLYREFQIA